MKLCNKQLEIIMQSTRPKSAMVVCLPENGLYTAWSLTQEMAKCSVLLPEVR